MNGNPQRGHGPRTSAGAGLLAIAALTALLAFGGCEPTDTELAKDGADGTGLSFLSADDFAAVSVDEQGLCLSGSATVTFSEPDQAFGFRFVAHEGDRVSAETGGDAALDTVVLLYGPDNGLGFFGAFPVAADDDGGAGLLSLIGAYEVKAEGTYMVVVTTFGGQWRGETTLALSVNGAGCAPGDADCPIACDDGDECTTEACRAETCEIVAVAEACGPDHVVTVCCELTRADGQTARTVLEFQRCRQRSGRPLVGAECQEPPPVGCCVVSRGDGTAERFDAPEADCLAIGDAAWEPRPCGAEPPMGEPVCCLFGRADGTIGRELTTDEVCAQENGQPAPAEECFDQPPPSGVCCAIPDAAGVVAFVLVETAEGCVQEGGQPVGLERCGTQPPPGEEVCCLLLGPEGFALERVILPADECRDRNGEPAPVEECRTDPPPAEDVCCWLGDPATGELVATVLLAEECLAQGGRPAPLEECGTQPPPTGDVCCLLVDAATGAVVARVMPAEHCAQENGVPAPLEECGAEPPPGEDVCCLIADPATGTTTPHLIPAERCAQENGLPVPLSECESQPPLDVCCAFVGADGQIHYRRVAEDVCAHEGGRVAPEEECDAAP